MLPCGGSQRPRLGRAILPYRHQSHPADTFCPVDIEHTKFLHDPLFEFVCCLVCWLVGFGFFTSFKPLIIFEVPVNLSHCLFHCSIPGDTKTDSSVLKVTWCAQETQMSEPQRLATGWALQDSGAVLSRQRLLLELKF